MPTNTQRFNLYKPDLGQKDPNEWGTGVNNNFDKIDRLLFYRAFLPYWGLVPPDSPSPYDDEFDDNNFNTTKWTVEDGGSGGLVVAEDDFGRLKIRRNSGPVVDYIYQTAFIDPSIYPRATFQVAHINHQAREDFADSKIESGFFIGDSSNLNQFSLLVWTNVFDNLLRIYKGNYLDLNSKGIEAYNYNYGRFPELMFYRFVCNWNGTSWDIMVQASRDGIHWKDLHYEGGYLSSINTFGIMLGDNDPGFPELYGSFYHFRFNSSVNPLNFK